MKAKRNLFIRPRKDRGGRWEVEGRLPRGSVPARIRKLFDTQEEAVAYANEIAPRLASLEPIKDQNLTLAQAFEKYFATKSRKKSLAEDKRIAEHLKAAFGEQTRLRDLTASRIAQYKGERLAAKSIRRKGEDGKPSALSAASINRPLALLRHLLRIASQEWETLPRVPVIRLEKEPQGRLRWLSEEEETALLAACAESQNKHLAAIVTVALQTGMRQAEVLGLTWDRVDFSRGVLRLEVTKSGKRREIPMRSAVDAVLSAAPGKTEGGRVWPDQSIRATFERAVTKTGLDDFTFHDLRHTFASRYMQRGGTLPALREILGHATLAMTMRYAHLSPAHLRAEMERTATAGTVQPPVVGTSRGHQAGTASQVPVKRGAGGGS